MYVKLIYTELNRHRVACILTRGCVVIVFVRRRFRGGSQCRQISQHPSRMQQLGLQLELRILVILSFVVLGVALALALALTGCLKSGGPILDHLLGDYLHIFFRIHV